MTSIGNVMTPIGGNLTFTLNVRNAGTLPYNCSALKAQARTGQGLTAAVAPLTGETGLACAGPNDTLAPGGDETFAFDIPLTGRAPLDVLALPFGSYASKVVWSRNGP